MISSSPSHNGSVTSATVPFVSGPVGEVPNVKMNNVLPVTYPVPYRPVGFFKNGLNIVFNLCLKGIFFYQADRIRTLTYTCNKLSSLSFKSHYALEGTQTSHRGIYCSTQYATRA